MKRFNATYLFIITILLNSYIIFCSHSIDLAATSKELDKKIKSNKSELINIQKEIEKQKSAIAKIENENSKISQKIKSSESFKKRQEKDKAIYDYNIKVADKKIGIVNDKLDSFEDVLDNKKYMLQKKARNYYDSYHVVKASVLSTAPQSFSNSLSLGEICKKDLSEYKNMLDQKENLVGEKSRLEDYKKMVSGYQEMAQKNILLAENRKSQRLENYNKVVKEKENLEQKIKRLQQQQGSLQKMLGQLATKSKKATVKKKSTQYKKVIMRDLNPSQSHTWPVKEGKKAIIASEPFNSNNVPHIDFSVAEDSPIYSIANGKVIYADEFKGYGNLIIIDHQDGYVTLYAYTNQITVNVDDDVAKGQQIATSGYIEQKAAGIRFEIRKDGLAVDPYTWF